MTKSHSVFSIFCAFVVLLLCLLSSEVYIIKMLPFLVEGEWWTVSVSSENFCVLSCYLLWLSTVKILWWCVHGHSGERWKGLLEVSCADSCLHIGMSPMWPVMFWVSSTRNYRDSWGKLFQSLPTLMVFFFLLLHWNLLYSSLCLLCYIILLCTAEGVWLSSLHLPKGGCSSTKISPFLKAWGHVPDNLSVLKLLYLLCVWVSACQLISGIQLWFRIWIDNMAWGTLVYVFSLWEII